MTYLDGQENTLDPRVLLVACRGLPASGKTTWARGWVADDPTRRARVCRDDLRQMLYGAGPDVRSYQAYFEADDLHVRESAVTAASHEAARGLLEDGRSVVADDTNLRVRYLRQWRELAGDCGAEFRVQDFTDVPVEECVRRDFVRGVRVGQAVIEDMHRRYLLGVTGLGLDDVDAGWRYVPDEAQREAFVVDVDGTLAINVGRSAYDYTRVSEDVPNLAVVRVVQELARRYEIVVVSGREGTRECFEDTARWLDDFGVPFHGLLMRAPGDKRSDEIVKTEILRYHVAPRWCVRGVLDDRNRVVRMWRRVGLLCMQVAPGAF